MSLLAEGLQELSLKADTDKLAAYAAELDRWNQVYGFVKANHEQLLTHHVLDALVAVPVVRQLGSTIADFGSGAGLPAIPLAIALPQVTFTLIERSEKRRAFLSAVFAHVGLQNAQVVERASGKNFDLVTARAVSPLPKLATFIANERLAPRLLVYAGTRSAIDAALCKTPFPVTVKQVRVPGVHAERHLITVHLRKKDAL